MARISKHNEDIDILGCTTRQLLTVVYCIVSIIARDRNRSYPVFIRAAAGCLCHVRVPDAWIRYNRKRW